MEAIIVAFLSFFLLTGKTSFHWLDHILDSTAMLHKCLLLNWLENFNSLWNSVSIIPMIMYKFSKLSKRTITDTLNLFLEIIAELLVRIDYNI